MSRPVKRLKSENVAVDQDVIRRQRSSFLASFRRDVSPPRSEGEEPARFDNSSVPDDGTVKVSLKSRQGPQALTGQGGLNSKDERPEATQAGVQASNLESDSNMRQESLTGTTRLIPSPFKLTKIRDLDTGANKDCISLHDILGNPLIKEAWVFNFCFDIDWMMQFFDPDIRQMVQVKIIHGSWKREDMNRMLIDEACTRWSNVQAATAFLPDPFGTHHSKMFVLFSHDDTAEVIIHTANMLEKDWTNMTQAVWRSGPLSKQPFSDEKVGPIGSGTRFRNDLLEYFAAYKKPCKDLVEKLTGYDFTPIRGALVASVPSKIEIESSGRGKSDTIWGHVQLGAVVESLKQEQPSQSNLHPHIVAQLSSIASLKAGWIQGFMAAAEGGKRPKSASSFSIIYPTAPNVAKSLDGYAAGGSIHTKAQSSTHLKQIDSLRPHLNQWTEGHSEKYRSGRHLAAPHIKTYMCFDRKPTVESLESGELEINWALLTSANLSTQAWGTMPDSQASGSKKKEAKEKVVHIQSFEIGVLVWPELFVEDDCKGTHGLRKPTRPEVRMIPVFGTDTVDGNVAGVKPGGTVVGLRMPYDLPLTPYRPGELPWSPQRTYHEPDSKGRQWLPNGS